MTEIVNKDAIEKRDSKPLKNRSRFNNSYKLAGTYRFGEYAPTMVADCVPDDNLKIKVSHVVKSYTMKQPLMQDIQLKDDTFLVPLSSILFRNYEKFITSPNIGDDVNASLVGTSVKGFSQLVYDALSAFYSYLFSVNDDDPPQPILSGANFAEFAFKYVVLVDTLLSSGSLLNSMGMPLVGNPKFIDNAINNFVGYFSGLGDSANFKCVVTINGSDYYLQPDVLNTANDSSRISVREFWNKIHDTSDWTFKSFTDVSNILVDVYSDSDIWDILDPNFMMEPDSLSSYDLARCEAYQISCAHFYSNDKVDYIYSADLWRQNLRSLYAKIDTWTSDPVVDTTFSWNGIDCYYDECSAFLISSYFQKFAYYFDPELLIDINRTNVNFFLDLVIYLFAYRRSLRYVDYFTGSRTRPLAVGDASVSVSGGSIDVVETIQKKWYIRLWSQIARVGHKLSEQMQGLFPGVKPSIDWHDPIWLHHNDGKVMASEVDNTGANQFDENTPIAVTSSLHGGSHGDTLNLSINDRYGIVITISYFDISRFYTKGVDRDILHVSRYDKFNPFLQFMGDQVVYLKELNTDVNNRPVFGYQGRYMEYKTRIDRAFGGLSNPEVLPAMIFLADYGRSLSDFQNISPNYIRSYPCELDRFFIALSGWSLGTYFHFIMLTNNEIDSSRPMAYNPQIQ